MDRSTARCVYYVVVCDQPHHSITKAKTGRELVVFRSAQCGPDLALRLILYPHVQALKCAVELNLVITYCHRTTMLRT